MVTALKQGVKYLFSVGGNAISETIKKVKGKLIHFLHGARCDHLQIVEMGTPVGFKNAKIEKLIERPQGKYIVVRQKQWVEGKPRPGKEYELDEILNKLRKIARIPDYQ